MRICVLSNSHGASIKWALDEADLSEATTVTIFGAPKRGLEGLKPDDDGQVVRPRNESLGDHFATTSGGTREIVLSDYDAFVVHGLFVTIPRLDRRHSGAVRAAAMSAMLDQALGLDIARSLSGWTDKPVALSPDPLFADLDLGPHGRWAPPPTEPVPYPEICEALLATADLGSVRFVPQPAETIGDRLDTRPEFSTGSRRILNDEEHKDADGRHMNGRYGALVLRDVLQALAA